MSYYEDQDVPRRHRSHRKSRRGPTTYEEEQVIESRNGRPSRQMDLIRRPRDDSTSSIEEVRRDYIPGGGEYVQRRTTTRDKYAPRARSADRYSDDYYHEEKRSSRRDKRGSRRSRYESDSESESYSPPRQRRKSLGEQALAALGLGGAAAAAASSRGGDRDRARSRSRGARSRYDSRSRSRSRSEDRNKKIQQALKSALTAGAVEAFRSRKEPGGWQGQGKRVITAAIGAAGVNGAVDRDPNKHSTRNTIEAVVGGLAGNRLINGPRSRSRSRGGGGRRREEKGGFGGTGALAATGLAALAGKALMDRSKSKDRGRGRRGSFSDDSRSPSPRRARSKSVSAYVTRGLDKGMAALGLGSNDKGNDRDRDDYRVSRRQADDGYTPRLRGGGGQSSSRSSSSDSFDSGEEEKKRKKLVGKEYLTAGLASVATIHAAHSVYQSMEKRDKRRKQVEEGKMSPEEAKKLKSRALLQDTASVGIAALGIKGAISEWKEMKEQRHECLEFAHELEEKRQKRDRRREMKRSRSIGQRNSDPGMTMRYSQGPRYGDGNPYGTLPPPPIGAASIRY